LFNSLTRKTVVYMICSTKPYRITGADPGFQVREGALKQIAPNGERRFLFLSSFYLLYTRMQATAKNYEIIHADTAHFKSGLLFYYSQRAV
jgi:hypothetical protein